MSIIFLHHHTKYEGDRSNGLEIIWNWNFQRPSFLRRTPDARRQTPDTGRLLVKWSPGSKTHKKHKISWFLKKNFVFGSNGRKHSHKINFVTQKNGHKRKKLTNKGEHWERGKYLGARNLCLFWNTGTAHRIMSYGVSPIWTFQSRICTSTLLQPVQRSTD